MAHELFTEYEAYTEEALQIDRELETAIETIFKAHPGIPIRELEYLAYHAINMISAEMLLTNMVAAAKYNRAEREEGAWKAHQ